MRGLAGHPADTDRHTGFKNVLEDYPDIKVLPNDDGVATGWDPAEATQLTNDFISSGALRQRSTASGRPAWTPGRRRDQGRRTSSSCRSSAPTSAPSSTKLLDTTELPGPRGRGGDQHRGRRRRGRQPGAQAPRTARRSRRTRRRHSRTRSFSTPVARRRTRPTRARHSSSPGRSIPGSIRSWPLGLQIEGYTTTPPSRPSPARARASSRTASTACGGCRHRRHPPPITRSRRPMTLTATDLLLEATGHRQDATARSSRCATPRSPSGRARSTR